MFAPLFGTVHHLLRQGAIGFCHFPLGVMGKDAFALGTGFRSPHGTGIYLVEYLDFGDVCLPDQFLMS